MDFIKITGGSEGEGPACISLIRKPDPVEPGPALRFSGGKIEFLEAGERLGAVLQRQREELGLTMTEVAAKTEFREDVYFRIEAGWNIRPSNEVLKMVAKVLNLSFAKLRDLADRDRDNPIEPFV